MMYAMTLVMNVGFVKDDALFIMPFIKLEADDGPTLLINHTVEGSEHNERKLALFRDMKNKGLCIAHHVKSSQDIRNAIDSTEDDACLLFVADKDSDALYYEALGIDAHDPETHPAISANNHFEFWTDEFVQIPVNEVGKYL